MPELRNRIVQNERKGTYAAQRKAVDDWRGSGKDNSVKVLVLFIGWCLLFVLCWPMALLALVLLPVIWLLSLPLRLVGITVSAAFAFVRALLFLPARLLGWKRA